VILKPIQMNKLFSPDPPPSPPAPSTHEVRHTDNVPRKDDDLSTVSQAVSTKWAATPAITLVWMLQADYATLVTNYINELAARKTSGTSRSPVTDTLETLDGQIDDGVREVKTYIAEKFGATHATANYPPFGIEHHSHGWELPRDHDKRRDALPLMIAAIAANGFGSKTYGTTFWTGIQTAFNAALASAGSTDSTTSTKVSNKNLYRTQIRNVLHSILLVLEGNYPNTFAGEKRAWGFQKEDY
jgi:hypothetical protein